MSSMYMQQINQYLEYFSATQLLLIDFDEMIHSSLATINKIETFIGARTTENNQLNEMYSNKSGSASAYRDVRKALDEIRNSPVVSAIIDSLVRPETRKSIRKSIDNSIRESFLVQKIAKSRTESIDKLSDKHIKYLSEKLRDDIESLERFWQRDLSHWKH